MSILDISPVVPVVVVDDATKAVPLARALVDGGIRVIEVTLRTDAALEAIVRIAHDVPEITVGAGTVVRADDAKRAADAGARFLVSPGTTPSVVEAMAGTGLPWLPGCATVSEVMAMREHGIGEVKLFPAEAVGGTRLLASLQGPLPDVRFCPTGGITAASAAAYLALPSVPCVGGSWLTPAEAVRDDDWARITSLAAEAALLSDPAGPDHPTA